MKNTLFCIQICTPKHESQNNQTKKKAENLFSENHALSPPHFRKFDYFFDCCRHIPKIIPKFGMQNLSSANETSSNTTDQSPFDNTANVLFVDNHVVTIITVHGA